MFKSGEKAPAAGTYVEVGQGGGQVKRAQRVTLNAGDSLPELKPYQITLLHKGEKRVKNRQHAWLLAK